MRQKLLTSAAFIILGAALAAPAAADITVFGTVDYDKQVIETETLTKTKIVTLTVSIVIRGASAAESNAINNQRIGPFGQTGVNSSTYTSGLDAARLGVDFFANMTRSVIGNTGITQVNQDVGTGSNQANLLSAAVGRLAFFAEANNAASQFVELENVTETGRVVTGTPNSVPPLRHAFTSGSVNNNIGVVMVNQNAGVFNNQVNSGSVALAFSPGAVALAESDLGQWNTNNFTREDNVTRLATIAASVNGNQGAAMGNQAAGYMANQANMLTVSASLTAPTSVNTGFSTFAGSITPNF